MAELLPCPFCGEMPKHYQYGIEWCVECHSSKCWIVPETGLCSSKEEATEKWNTRTQKKEVLTSQKITCLNCKHLEITLPYGECSRQLRIVGPDDTCEFAEPKERGGEK